MSVNWLRCLKYIRRPESVDRGPAVARKLIYMACWLADDNKNMSQQRRNNTVKF